ncbi:hypothetical protein T552_04207 [Pneumocystis carinii B80]|uniref:Uncharacterized protein n=1 Tax=Pneumocystis carinii (strain B80) TaxID=1408658 RepID=A0A0W4ZC65_PNEC8|nr:hypothetical protein T552_04207 [Pneumocystis carinii B80]KTW26004.1 hypothetical protein T552_04207 [Pneumocystis carinii B80]
MFKKYANIRNFSKYKDRLNEESLITKAFYSALFFSNEMIVDDLKFLLRETEKNKKKEVQLDLSLAGLLA